jgi:hypothetical protein
MIERTRGAGGPGDGRDTASLARAGARFAEALRSARRRGAGVQDARAPARPGPLDRAGPRRLTPEATGTARAEEIPPRVAADAGQQRTGADVQAAASVDALRAAVRALPAAVEAARVAGGAQVALAFGSALGVDLRAGAGGLEVTLRPAAALERAAAAELPGLVAALRARGFRVARATVQARSGTHMQPIARAASALTPPRASGKKGAPGTVAKW